MLKILSTLCVFISSITLIDCCYNAPLPHTRGLIFVIQPLLFSHFNFQICLLNFVEILMNDFKTSTSDCQLAKPFQIVNVKTKMAGLQRRDPCPRA